MKLQPFAAKNKLLFFYKTCVNMQQMLPVQMGLYSIGMVNECCKKLTMKILM